MTEEVTFKLQYCTVMVPEPLAQYVALSVVLLLAMPAAPLASLLPVYGEQWIALGEYLALGVYGLYMYD